MSTRNLLPDTAPLIAATLIVTLIALGSAAAPPPFSADGWHTWRIAAVENAPNWCCFEWNGAGGQATTCELDSGRQGYSYSSDDSTNPDAMQIYLRISAGKPVELRTLSTSCPVRSKDDITDHGTMSQADSVSWLRRQVEPRGKLSSEALAAISVHAGDAARRFIVDTARGADSFDNRKDAVFWMGQTRASETATELQSLMFDDPSAEMRKHAAFSWSQSDISDRGDALIRLGRTDKSTDVRGQAWFWLSQSGDPASERAIRKALRDEDSRKVRDQAIFALSQLPDDRGVDALIEVLESRNLADKDRKQALFWLAQSDSDRAFDYLARVLD